MSNLRNNALKIGLSKVILKGYWNYWIGLVIGMHNAIQNSPNSHSICMLAI